MSVQIDPPIYPHTYTYIEDVGYVCDDCGAHGEIEDEIVHYPSCTPGESERWRRAYTEDAEIDRDAPEYYHPDEPPDDDPNPYEGTYSEE